MYADNYHSELVLASTTKVKPADKPDDAKSVDAKPQEVKPYDTKSADAKPGVDSD